MSLRALQGFPLNVMQFLCLFLQFIMEDRVGNFDQCLRALADGFAIEVCNAIFGHHETDVIAARHYARAWFQHGDDLAQLGSIP